MGTDVALETKPAARSVAVLGHGSPIAIVPQSFDEVYRLAQVVAASDLAPYDMKTPEKVTVAILTGLELGVKPMQAIQGIAVINGRPCVWGDLALAICRATGDVEYVTETFEGEEPDDPTVMDQPKAARRFKAVCKIKRKGQPEVVNEFSVGDAITAKLWLKRGRNGADTPWVTNWKRMMKMRARGFSLRDLFTDALKGMYVAEELIGTEDPNDGRRAGAPPPPAEITQQAGPEAQQEHPTAQQAAAQQPAGKGAPPPPADDVQDAEVVGEGGDQPGAGEPVTEQDQGVGVVMGETSPSSTGEGGPADDADRDHSFDGEGWLEETAEVFASCKTPKDVDEAHEMFEETVRHELNSSQRSRYEDIHTAAMKRVEGAEPVGTAPQPPAEDVDADEESFGSKAVASEPKPDREPELSPHDRHATWLRGAIKADGLKLEDIENIWNNSKPERADMVKDGTMTVDQRKALWTEVKTRFDEISIATSGAPAAAGGEAKPQAEAPTSSAADNGPTRVAFTDRFAARLKALDTVEAINDFSAETLPERNALGAGHDAVRKGWSQMVTNRRNEIMGI